MTCKSRAEHVTFLGREGSQGLNTERHDCSEDQKSLRLQLSVGLRHHVQLRWKHRTVCRILQCEVSSFLLLIVTSVRFSSTHSCDYEWCDVMRCNVMLFCRNPPTFRRNVSPLLSESKSKSLRETASKMMEFYPTALRYNPEDSTPLAIGWRVRM
jgi:hypothetical protein